MSDAITRAASSLTTSYAQQQQQVQREQAMQRQRAQQRAQVAQQPEATSIWGHIGNALRTAGEFVADKWTDDFSSVPVAGPVASGIASGYTAVTTDMNRAASAGLLFANQNFARNSNLSAWDAAQEISVGQASVALADTMGFSGQNLYDQDPGFDVSSESDRKKAFESGGAGQWTSGVVDGLFTWFLDPFVIGGKAVKVARFGTTAMGMDVVGLTGRRVTGRKIIGMLEAEADNALAGAETPLGFAAKKVAAGDYDELRKFSWFQGSNRDTLATVGHHIDNERDATVFLAAAAGSRRYQEILRAEQANTFLTLQRQSGKANPYEERILNRAFDEDEPPILDELLDEGVTGDQVVADLMKRDEGLRAALAVVDEQPFGLLERAGSRSVNAAKIADAWKQGREVRKTLIKRQVRNEARLGTGPAAFERIYQLSSMAPRVRVWEWVAGSHASGYIDVRGWNDGKASDELSAAMSDSKTIRNNGEFKQRAMNLWGQAQTATERMGAIRSIERSALAEMLLAKNVAGVTRGADGKIKMTKEAQDNFDRVYGDIDRRRFEVVEGFKSRTYGVIDGDVAKAGPRLQSQLEVSMPMLNFAVMEKTANILAKPHYNMARAEDWARAGYTVRNMMDEVQSLWKAGVLLRLGYTQRNTLEGWLRSAAFLGTVPALKHPFKSTGNSFFNNYRRVKGKTPGIGLRSLSKDQDLLITDITNMRREMDALRLQREELLAANPATKTLDIDRSLAQLDDNVSGLEARLDRINSRVDSLKSRKFYDNGAFSGKFKYKGVEYDLDFEYGDLVRQLSSAQKTTEQFLYSAWMRGSAVRLNSNNWVKVEPGKPQYWDELATSVRQFRADPLARQVLEGKSTGELVAWAKSAEGRPWRRNLMVAQDEVEGKVAEIEGMVFDYLPTLEARAAAAAGEVSPAQMKQLLNALDPAKKTPGKAPKRKDYASDKSFKRAVAAHEQKVAEYRDSALLKPIHGKEVARVTNGDGVMDYVHKPIDILFKALGTYPESTLVRHPFYAEVWMRRMKQMADQAKSQGVVLDDAFMAKINTSAHRAAMRATNETLYTIERYSNLASMMRWAAPFFAAWENSAKVWTRMVVNDPSIAARASILWQIPNQLGMVTDADGNVVKDDNPLNFLTGSQDRFVQLPKPIADVVEKYMGVPLKIPQGALNVVTPGNTPWLPGMGPIVNMPVGMFLATKPDVQKTLRDFLGSSVYEQFVPFGVAEGNPVRQFAPAWVRKWMDDYQGENSKEWLATASAMMQTAMVDWYKSGGRPEDRPDPDVIMQRAHDFYKFSALASLTLPFATTRTSKYQQQIDNWNAIKADGSMTWNEKVETFIRKWGDDFTPLMTSTSKSNTGVDPTQEDYAILRENSGLARELAAVDPYLVGILGMSAPVGKFDRGVYEWMQNETIVGTDTIFRERLNPAEYQSAAIMQDAWRDYRKAKTIIDTELAARGVSSLQAESAADLKAQWDTFMDDMATEYGQPWITEFYAYQDRTPRNLAGIQMALENESFMSQQANSNLWGAVQVYMDRRQQTLDAIANGADSAAARDEFAAWAGEFRFSSLEFSDFFDRFLDNDQLQDIRLEQVYG
jgi:hypothetical protein